MKRLFLLLALLAFGWAEVPGASASTNVVAPDRLLIIDSSSMPVGGGSATLTIGVLRRVDGVYHGDYKLKVFPYFFKNEKGRLAINVSDAVLAGVRPGKVVAVTGTATTIDRTGHSRAIEATATPADLDHGTLKLWFMAGGRKMTFETAYHFSGNAATVGLTPNLNTNLAPPSFLVVVQKP